MDWPLAISRNLDALRRIVAALFALAGLAEGATADVLPRRVYGALLFILRPAESAVRRLIVLAARGIAVKAHEARPMPAGLTFFANPETVRVPAFALFDPLKSFDPATVWNMDPAAQIRFESGFGTDIDPFSGFRVLPDQREIVPATQIIQRLFAIGNALETLPNQARRLLRWQARRDVALKAQRPVRITPLRPGFPPGWRQRPIHEIDDLLKECHRLAIDVMNAPDTG